MDSAERNRLLNEFATPLQFEVGKSSYVDVYEKWKDRTKPFLPWLLGVYEIPDDEYRNVDREEILKRRGHELKFIKYNPNNPEYYDRKTDYDVTGVTCVGRTPSDEIRSVVFMRESVFGLDRVPTGVDRNEVAAFNKLATLLHEIGHAYDAELQKNYDHSLASFDEIPGEFFAHHFSFQVANACKYNDVIQCIVDSMIRDALSQKPVYSVAAQLMLEFFENIGLHIG